MTVTCDALNLTIQRHPGPRLSSRHGTSLNMLSTVQGPPFQDMFKFVHYEACTVVTWVVGVLPKCFLVVDDFFYFSTLIGKDHDLSKEPYIHCSERNCMVRGKSLFIP